MNTDKIILDITKDIEFSKSIIKDTCIDTTQFTINVKQTYRLQFLESTLDMILQHKSYIGTNVYKFLNNIRYTSIDDISKIDNWNKVDTVATLFNDILFNNFVKELIELRIKYFIDELTLKDLTYNSTNKLKNIVYEFEVEEKQELLKYFKSLLI